MCSLKGGCTLYILYFGTFGFVTCNKSHEINLIVYHRYLWRFLWCEINHMEQKALYS